MGNDQKRDLTTPWQLGGIDVPNRVVLAPLAGIGNWFVRLQAKRYGAGLAVSEMVSSHGLAYGDRRTTSEFLRLHPDEHPVSVQLFGADPAIMREAAAMVASAGAAMIDLNMGCPVKKVCKTGAGSALLKDHDTAVAVAVAAREGSGLPVTVKLRPGHRPGELDGVVLAEKLVHEAGVAGISFHPRHSSQQHKGLPDYDLARSVVESLPVPVMISGGLLSAEKAQYVFDYTGCEAVLLARGSLGNPWIFQQALGTRAGEPSVAEVLEEWQWVIDRCGEHYEDGRGARYLRKFYPWYLDKLRAIEPELFTRSAIGQINAQLQETHTLSDASAVVRSIAQPVIA
ncbi:MAG: tRNA-dihydrouridine synthase [Thermoleophilaceae bacterium]|nr:tRNA-dihydrouridine synthase [Thermoleophilaceae bacterium]